MARSHNEGMATATSIRAMFAAHDNAVVIGNGMHAHIPCYFNPPAQLQDAMNNIPGVRSFVLAGMTLAARKGGGGLKNNDPDAVRAAAEKEMAETLERVLSGDNSDFPSYLEEATDDYLYQYNRIPADEKKAKGYTVVLERTINGAKTLCTSFALRYPFVKTILSIDPTSDALQPDGKTLRRVLKAGWHRAGEAWADVVASHLDSYRAEIRYQMKDGKIVMDDEGNPIPRRWPEGGTAAAPAANGEASHRDSAEDAI